MTRKMDRFERIADNRSGEHVSPEEMARLLRNEHKWMRRMVKGLRKECAKAKQLDGVKHEHHRGWDNGSNFVLSVIETRLTQRRG